DPSLQQTHKTLRRADSEGEGGIRVVQIAGSNPQFLAETVRYNVARAAFVAYMARETNPAFTATQLALFTSLAVVPRTLINATTGYLINWLGYVNFFWLCFLLAFPGMLLLFKVAPWNQRTE
ncbi:tRNA-dihydrouridine synthase, partial [Snodgrassella alvi SCGC AB-598-O02]